MWHIFFTSVPVLPLHHCITCFDSPSILQQPPSVFEGACFSVGYNKFLLSCVGALSSIITDHRGLIIFEEWDGIVDMYRYRTCFKFHFRRLGNVQLIPLPKGIKTERTCTRGGNQTSVPVQALDHKFNSLPLDYRTWPVLVCITYHFWIFRENCQCQNFVYIKFSLLMVWL